MNKPLTFEDLKRRGNVMVYNVGEFYHTSGPRTERITLVSPGHVIVTFLPFVNINRTFEAAGPDLAAALANLEAQLSALTGE